MALLRINDTISLGVKGRHNATSWQVALDENFENIIEESIKDTINVKEWHAKLPKINGVGYYADLDKLFARVKAFSDESESEWFILEPKNQNDQTIIVTEEGQPDKVYNSLEMGLK